MEMQLLEARCPEVNYNLGYFCVLRRPPFLCSGVESWREKGRRGGGGTSFSLLRRGSWREKGAPGRWRKASRHTAAPYLRETGR
jgi:hypothetical protein